MALVQAWLMKTMKKLQNQKCSVYLSDFIGLSGSGAGLVENKIIKHRIEAYINIQQKTLNFDIFFIFFPP